MSRVNLDFGIETLEFELDGKVYKAVNEDEIDAEVVNLLADLGASQDSESLRKAVRIIVPTMPDEVVDSLSYFKALKIVSAFSGKVMEPLATRAGVGESLSD